MYKLLRSIFLIVLTSCILKVSHQRSYEDFKRIFQSPVSSSRLDNLEISDRSSFSDNDKPNSGNTEPDNTKAVANAQVLVHVQNDKSKSYHKDHFAHNPHHFYYNPYQYYMPPPPPHYPHPPPHYPPPPSYYPNYYPGLYPGFYPPPVPTESKLVLENPVVVIDDDTNCDDDKKSAVLVPDTFEIPCDPPVIDEVPPFEFAEVNQDETKPETNPLKEIEKIIADLQAKETMTDDEVLKEIQKVLAKAEHDGVVDSEIDKIFGDQDHDEPKENVFEEIEKVLEAEKNVSCEEALKQIKTLCDKYIAGSVNHPSDDVFKDIQAVFDKLEAIESFVSEDALKEIELIFKGASKPVHRLKEELLKDIEKVLEKAQEPEGLSKKEALHEIHDLLEHQDEPLHLQESDIMKCLRVVLTKIKPPHNLSIADAMEEVRRIFDEAFGAGRDKDDDILEQIEAVFRKLRRTEMMSNDEAMEEILKIFEQELPVTPPKKCGMTIGDDLVAREYCIEEDDQVPSLPDVDTDGMEVGADWDDGSSEEHSNSDESCSDEELHVKVPIPTYDSVAREPVDDDEPIIIDSVDGDDEVKDITLDELEVASVIATTLDPTLLDDCDDDNKDIPKRSPTFKKPEKYYFLDGSKLNNAETCTSCGNCRKCRKGSFKYDIDDLVEQLEPEFERESEESDVIDVAPVEYVISPPRRQPMPIYVVQYVQAAPQCEIDPSRQQYPVPITSYHTREVYHSRQESYPQVEAYDDIPYYVFPQSDYLEEVFQLSSKTHVPCSCRRCKNRGTNRPCSSCAPYVGELNF